MNARGEKVKRKKRKAAKPDNPAQSARFIESAKKLGLYQKGGDFDKLLDQLLTAKKPKKPAK